MRKTQLDHVVDSICNRGCRYVNTLLSDSEARCRCQELLNLDQDQQRKVMDELKSVMSVYQQTGSCRV